MVLRMTLDQPLVRQPSSFARDYPPQVWLDFPQTRNAVRHLPKLSGPIALRNVRVAQDAYRTRVVIDLATEPSYAISVNGNVVSVVFEPSVARAAAPRELPAQAAAR